jgi:RNA polymerase sigma-70 factor (ECF subfamily)
LSRDADDLGLGHEVFPEGAASRAELWSRAAEGDHAAFGYFVELHRDTVYGVCKSRLGNQQDAEDATQRVFLKFWESRHRVSFHQQADVLPWLLQTMRNVVGDFYRAELRREKKRSWLEQQPVQDVSDIADEVAEQDAAQRERRLMRQTLARLRPEDQRILTLAAAEDLIEAVAKTLGLSNDTARKRLRRARERFREQYVQLLREEDGGPKR